MPTNKLTALATKPTANETRAPSSVRANRSRPSRSVPNQCALCKAGCEATWDQSKVSLLFGLNHGPISVSATMLKVTMVAHMAAGFARKRRVASPNKVLIGRALREDRARRGGDRRG